MRTLGKFFAASLTLLVTTGVLGVLATSEAAPGSRQGQPAVQKSAEEKRADRVKALLAANPRGGEKLEAALAALIIADPAYAATVANASASANPAQQVALGASLGRAEAVLATNNPAAAAVVSAAAKTAPPAVQAAAIAAERSVAQSLNASAAGGGNSGAGGGNPSGEGGGGAPSNQFVLTPTTSGGSGGSSSSN